MSDLVTVILAAGKGTRMKSKLPKVLHKAAGKSMVQHVIDAAKAAGAKRNIVVTGFGGEEVRKVALNKFPHRMIHEFVEFGETFENKDYKKVEDGLKVSLDVMKVAEDAAKFAGIKYE